MKPSDLRRDAYTWQAIAQSAEARAEALTDFPQRQAVIAGQRLEDAAASIREAIDHMNRAADELEARNAS